TTPAYDDAQTIYDDLISKINWAYENLDSSAVGFEDQDIVYHDNIESWKKLASTIKFKIGMRLADQNPSLSQTLVTEAVSQGIFSSSSDSFSLQYENNNTNANPLYADLYLSGRQDFVPANTFVDNLNELEDPRRSVFFDSNLVDDDGNVYYEGGIYGSLNNYSLFTHIGSYFYAPDIPVILMDYSEIEFLLAEAVERGYSVGGSAEEHYNNAIRANMEFWEIEEAA